MTLNSKTPSIINVDGVPNKFPTHLHSPEFWESLGRAVASFGFLENVMTKAIFAFTATKPYSKSEIDEAFTKWEEKLKKSLSDPLGSLIDTYGKAANDHPDFTIKDFDKFLNELREASNIRNVLCHGSWGLPDAKGASVPSFVNRQQKKFMTPIDEAFLNQVQAHTVDLICSVINTVTRMGWQFPGSNGLGKTIWDKG